jgi:hypothetical protein
MITDVGGLASMRPDRFTKDQKPNISLEDLNHPNPSQLTRPSVQSDWNSDKNQPTTVDSRTTEGAATS